MLVTVLFCHFNFIIRTYIIIPELDLDWTVSMTLDIKFKLLLIPFRLSSFSHVRFLGLRTYFYHAIDFHLTK